MKRGNHFLKQCDGCIECDPEGEVDRAYEEGIIRGLEQASQKLAERSASYAKALNNLSISLHKHIERGEYALLDQVWYDLEMADRVLEGDTLEEAQDKFIDPDWPPPERWRKHG